MAWSGEWELECCQDQRLTETLRMQMQMSVKKMKGSNRYIQTVKEERNEIKEVG